MGKTTRGQSGITLAEAMVALALLGLTVGGTLTSFVMGCFSATNARYSTQGINLLQAKVEELTAGLYEDVRDQGPSQVTIDPGPDLEWGTDDDALGDLRVEVDDRSDLDGDGDTVEEEIDVDGDGGNDRCKPVHVSVTRTCVSFGGRTSVTVHLDTLIAEH